MQSSPAKRRHFFIRCLSSFSALIFTLFAVQCVSADRPFPDPPAEQRSASPGQATAVLAGGCFWGMEGVFERLKGVTDVVSGYSGGDKSTADYANVSTGATGHAESVRIQYDPSQITFGTLLKVFFDVAHDPTELNYQGPDHGTQYRSAVFYTNEEQKRVAEAYIRAIDQAGIFPQRIVTQVTPFQSFYPAEAYHQNFMDNNPDYPYIRYWDAPKVNNLLKMYPELVARK
jgi:peptide-methionine (S)-S-oxide reductase